MYGEDVWRRRRHFLRHMPDAIQFPHAIGACMGFHPWHMGRGAIE